MTAPTVEAAIHELMDLAWKVVYDLLEQRGLLGDGLFVEEYTGIHSWLDGPTRYTVVHSQDVAEPATAHGHLDFRSGGFRCLACSRMLIRPSHDNR